MAELSVFVAFLKEALVSGFDCLELLAEAPLCGFGKFFHKCRDLLAASGLWVQSDVTLDNFLLVEMAKLDGNSREQAFQQAYDTFSAVNGETGKLPSLSFQVEQILLNICQLLAVDLVPVNVPAQRTIDQKPITASEKRAIEDQGNRKGKRAFNMLAWGISIELPPQGADANTILRAQLRQCLLANSIVVVCRSYPMVFLTTWL